MAVHVIDTIKPKNNLNFPVVEAPDVKVSDTLRLDEALEKNAADLTTTAANLQAQIDALITPVTQDAEVENARVGVDGTTYQTLKGRLDSYENSTNTIISQLIDVTVETEYETEVTAISTISGKRVSANTTQYKVALTNDSSSSVKVFEIEKGKRYKVYGFGYDLDSYYVATISDVAFTETGNVLQLILCGASDYPDDFTYHTIEFVANYTGYLGVNYQTSGNAATLYESSFVQKLPEGYNDLVEDVSENTATIDELVEAVAVEALVNPVSATSTYTDQRVSENTSLGITSLTNETGWSVKVFPVSKGTSYRVRGFGYDRDGFYLATVSDRPFTSPGILLQKIECGASDYPDDFTYHTVDFIAAENGYIGVNYKTAEESALLFTEKLMPKAPLMDYNHVVIKSNGEYNVLSRIHDNVFVSRVYKHCNANNLFQLYKLGYGTYDGLTYVEIANKMTASTDIVGPASIGRYNSSTGYEAGEWSGGNHAKMIDNTPCRTAEEVSFKAVCSGTDISNAADGVYNGVMTFICENDLYFPQTITDNNFTDAVKAIREKREYRISDDMKVKVTLKMLYDEVGFAVYYGMQMQIPSDVTSVNNPAIERLVLKTDNEKVVFSNPSDAFYIDTETGWHYDMVLDSVGLETRTHVDSSQSYLENYGYGQITAAFSKIYQTLICHDHLPQDAVLTWSGTYKMYQD